MGKARVTAEPGKQEISISRVFNAPRELVWKAMTTPELVSQWWGQRSTTTIVDKLEPKPGGGWRYIEREANGTEYAFRGVYHTVNAPELTIGTFEFEPMPGHVLLETTRLEEQPDGTTKVTALSVFQSVADRDGMLQSGMEGGTNESYDQLDELLAKMQQS
jgi:uncharacterized protein YndB with AHSA1/START domain